MANSEHVDVVKEGEAAIRVWREQHPDARLDLVDADLHGADLQEARLATADLHHGGLQCARPVAWLPTLCVGLRAPLNR